MLSDVVATQIRTIREMKGITREQLADRCIALGAHQLTFGPLGSIETGRPGHDGKRRREITLDEFLAIARALDVPPISLLFPLENALSEPLPGTSVPTQSAIDWFTGEKPFSSHELPKVEDLNEFDLQAWHVGNAVLRVLQNISKGEITHA